MSVRLVNSYEEETKRHGMEAVEKIFSLQFSKVSRSRMRNDQESFSSAKNDIKYRKYLMCQWGCGKRSRTYLVFRWVMALFFIATFAMSIYDNIKLRQIGVYLIYLSHLSLIATTVVMTYSAVLVTLNHFDFNFGENIERILTFYWASWNASFVFASIVTICYWSMLYEGKDLVLGDISLHLTNFLPFLIDLGIVKHPPKYKFFIHIVLLHSAYLVFTVLYQFLGGLDKHGQNYVYPITDWRKKPIPAAITFVIINIFSIILHFSVNLVHSLKMKIHEKFFKRPRDVRLRNCHEEI